MAHFAKEERTYQMRTNQTGKQAYTNVEFAAGTIEDHPLEQVYLLIAKNRDESSDWEHWILRLQRHEALAVIWLLSQAVWASELGKGEQDD